ncbi:NAD(P)H-hydrate epimerase [Treponema parvum]|uniref:ADP-dependent (S)-NAD(P)H-hydrate dehydratase n=1 Tax=Treponema parvum TaxID=138851 RepID=A0A975IBM1_9SPIR|nr:NAD(P)H-hydrate epimerase [Treponema parvum]QTQ10963.1 NAD(P)H-hydrate epimerase [Treponema parvum]
MKPLFADTRFLDQAAQDAFALTEDIMMENAAAALEFAVRQRLSDKNAAGENTSAGSVLIVTGGGNNGADGMTLARRMNGEIRTAVYCAAQPKSKMCVLQCERAKKTGVVFLTERELKKNILLADVIVDCIYGSGFHGKFDKKTANLVERINLSKAYKIACDIPSGIDAIGVIETKDSRGNLLAFRANKTVAMGALKTAFFSDAAKDFCGKDIVLASLGVGNKKFETAGIGAAAGALAEMPTAVLGTHAGASSSAISHETKETARPSTPKEKVLPEAFLLERSDMKLPYRTLQNVNKGNFGHAAVICGEKPGAALIAGSAAFAFGAGLVTLVHANAGRPENAAAESGAQSAAKPYDRPTAESCGKGGATAIPNGSNNLCFYCPPELMQSSAFPLNTKSVALGMGLGADEKAVRGILTPVQNLLLKNKNIRCVLDADMFSLPQIKDFLDAFALSEKERRLVLTPHPKEFLSLLNICGISGGGGLSEKKAQTPLSVEEVVKDRINLSKRFLKKYPGSVLLLKGANVCISYSANGEIFTMINSNGNPCLAKGGSGDVLAGMTAALLAQGYTAVDAAVSASLAHAFASQKAAKCTEYGLTPFMLIEKVRSL